MKKDLWIWSGYVMPWLVQSSIMGIITRTPNDPSPGMNQHWSMTAPLPGITHVCHQCLCWDFRESWGHTRMMMMNAHSQSVWNDSSSPPNVVPGFPNTGEDRSDRCVNDWQSPAGWQHQRHLENKPHTASQQQLFIKSTDDHHTANISDHNPSAKIPNHC